MSGEPHYHQWGEEIAGCKRLIAADKHCDCFVDFGSCTRTPKSVAQLSQLRQDKKSKHVCSLLTGQCVAMINVRLLFLKHCGWDVALALPFCTDTGSGFVPTVWTHVDVFVPETQKLVTMSCRVPLEGKACAKHNSVLKKLQEQGRRENRGDGEEQRVDGEREGVSRRS